MLNDIQKKILQEVADMTGIPVLLENRARHLALEELKP